MVLISKLNLQQAKNLLLFACKSKNSSLIPKNRINYSNVKLLSTFNSTKFRNDRNLLDCTSPSKVR